MVIGFGLNSWATRAPCLVHPRSHFRKREDMLFTSRPSIVAITLRVMVRPDRCHDGETSPDNRQRTKDNGQRTKLDVRPFSERERAPDATGDAVVPARDCGIDQMRTCDRHSELGLRAGSPQASKIDCGAPCLRCMSLLSPLKRRRAGVERSPLRVLKVARSLPIRWNQTL
jgi:hypothetical protein